MSAIGRTLVQTICFLLIAVGLFGALGSSFFIAAMVYAWFSEGRLLAGDLKLLVHGIKWFLVASLVVGVAWWSYRKIATKNGRDDSFRLVRSGTAISDPRTFEAIELIFFTFLGLVIWPFIPGNFMIRIPLVVGWLVVGLLGTYVCIALHELGHLGAAWLVNMKLGKMQVGVGPVLWSRCSAGGFIWQWRVWPYGGFTFAVPQTTKEFRIRQLLFVAGGPLMDVIFLCFVYWIITRFFGGLREAWQNGPFGSVISVLFCRHAIEAGHGLIPLRFCLGNQQTWTDGFWIVRLLTGSKATIRQLAEGPNWAKALESLQQDSEGRLFQKKAPEETERSADLPGFSEQQEVLGSRLLCRSSPTSVPPA